MVWIALIIVAVILLAVFAAIKKRAGEESSSSFPYRKVEALFTPAERSFFGALSQAIGKDYLPFGKVRVADILEVRKGLEKSARSTAFNKISAKHFDFVLCSPTDLSVLCAIELNDSSHNSKKRQDRDDFLENACKAASLPLIVFPAQAAYSLAEIKGTIETAFPQLIATPPQQTKMANDVRAEPSIAPQNSAVPDTEPLCPKCSSPMIKRIAKAGENAGKEFWGCSKFPTCRAMVFA